MENKNILLKKAPEKLSNILKGVSLIILSLPLTIFSFIMIGMSGFKGDVQGPDRSTLAIVIAGGIFLVFFIAAIKIMMRSNKKV